MTVSGIVTLIAALVIILRLITYRRGGSRYRPGIGVAAWASIAACAVAIAEVLATGAPRVGWLAILLPAFAVMLLLAGGNLAHLLRPPWRF
ncbi:phage holin family protein [Halomonas sp. HG01]|uniref:phage holin family protein n=1 Tax=Halomonas sp. HG01 TaxID=1609967 RepID=UPI0006146229|nr:phage holin family protein [Halomonas sp. HG01]